MTPTRGNPPKRVEEMKPGVASLGINFTESDGRVTISVNPIPMRMGGARGAWSFVQLMEWMRFLIIESSLTKRAIPLHPGRRCAARCERSMPGP